VNAAVAVAVGFRSIQVKRLRKDKAAVEKLHKAAAANHLQKARSAALSLYCSRPAHSRHIYSATQCGEFSARKHISSQQSKHPHLHANEAFAVSSYPVLRPLSDSYCIGGGGTARPRDGRANARRTRKVWLSALGQNGRRWAAGAACEGLTRACIRCLDSVVRRRVKDESTSRETKFKAQIDRLRKQVP
jgi:hypothetical protein